MEDRTTASFDRYMVFAVLAIASGMGNCSQTALNAMMGQICATVGVDLSIGQWLTTSYILALGIAVPLAPFIFKRFSEKVLVISSLVLAIVGCLLIIFTTSFPIALLGRVMQACSTGFALPFTTTIIMTDLPRKHTGLFMGIAGVAMGFMINLGPTIAGAMESAFGWESFFWLYGAIDAIMLLPTALFAHKHVQGSEQLRFDYRSYVVCSVGFVALLLGFSNASSYGFVDLLTVWAPIAAGAVLLVVFIRSQLHMDEPLISMRIFDTSEYWVGFVGLCLLYASFIGIMLVIPQYVEELRGGTSLDAGMVLLPAAVISFISNLASGALMDKIGSRKVLCFTATCLMLGATMAIFCNENTPLVYLIVAQAIRTIGVSGSIGPLVGYSLLKVEPCIVSDANAFSTLVRQAAASLGTSIMVFLITLFNAGGVCALAYQAAFAFSAIVSICFFVLIVRSVH